MAAILNTKPVASAKVGENATVLILGIHYNEALPCDRRCCMLDPDDDGNLVCGHGWVRDIVNYQSRALVIDYQCILDKDAGEDWDIYESHFKVIDDEGFIHEGSVLCDRIHYPVRTVEDGHTLYRGTRANIVIQYPDFPKGRSISAIVIDKDYAEKTRIELGSPMSEAPEAPVSDSGRKDVRQAGRVITPGNPDDLLNRIESLEETVRELQERIRQLSGGNVADAAPPVPVPPAPKRTDESGIHIDTVAELLALDPAGFRDVMIRMLREQGFNDIVTISDPEVGYGSITGSRFGTTYFILTVQENQSNHASDLNKVQWLIRFKKTHRADKGIYITSGKLSRDAEMEAISNGVEIMDIDRISIMLSLRSDSFGYQPLKR